MSDKEDVPSVVLSGSSPIQVKFIGWLVIVCAGGFGGWIWWASSMSTKLDVVIANQAAQLASVKALAEDVSRLKEWRIQVDTIGSPAIVKRVDILKQEVDDLAKAFAMYKAAAKP